MSESFQNWCKKYKIELQNIDSCRVCPLILIAGGCKDTQTALQIDSLLSQGLSTRKPRLYISGGTLSGVCAATGKARKRSGSNVYLIGFCPRKNQDNTVSPYHVPLDTNYDEIYFTKGEDFSVEEVDAYWDFLEKDIQYPVERALLVGAGGGALSRLEYERALQKGAGLLLVEGSGRAADEMLMELKERKDRRIMSFPLTCKPRYLKEKIRWWFREGFRNKNR